MIIFCAGSTLLTSLGLLAFFDRPFGCGLAGVLRYGTNKERVAC